MKMIYLSPVPWRSISQRPHFFVEQALAAGYEVLWVEPYASRLPSWQDFIPGRHRAEPAGLEQPAGLTIVSAGFLLPVEPLGCVFEWCNGKKLKRLYEAILAFSQGEDVCSLVMGKPSRLALKLLAEPHWAQTWFDAMDNYPAFYSGLSRKAMVKLEDNVSRKVDLVSCSSHPLAEKFLAKGCQNVELILNACSPNIGRNGVEIAKNKLNPPILGYVGTIASWFDWEWVRELAINNPKAEIHLYGPLKVRVPTNLERNIKLFAPVPHHQLNEIYAAFTAGIIPFKLNEITNYVDPVKFYEYLAHDLPILSTPFGEMKWHENTQNVFTTSSPGNINMNSGFSLCSNREIPCWHYRWSNFFNEVRFKC